MVEDNPLPYLEPSRPPSRVCESCGSASLTTGYLAAYVEPVEMFACDECGDFWFERAGRRLTAEAMRDLGLLIG
jgi:hypothetical protein